MTRNRSKSQGGLTLLEVIIAITITAVIMGILLSAMRLGQRSQDKALEREDLSQRMRILSDRIGWLIRGAYPYRIRGEEPTKWMIFFNGDAESAGFVTTGVDEYSGSLLDASGLKWVSIYADQEGLKIKETYFFNEEVLGESFEGEEFLLDPTVKRITFQYLDPGEEEGEESWVDIWDPQQKDYLPTAVRVSIVLTFKGEEINMPPFEAAIRTGGPEKETAAQPAT